VIEEYILEYVDPLLRDYMIKYLRTFIVLYTPKPRDHATRMETLVRYNRISQAQNRIFATNEEYDIRIISSDLRQSWIRAGKA
jgi:hypothetical protein